MNEFIVVLDLETTGLDPQMCAILEVGILVANEEFEVIAKRNWLIENDIRWDFLHKDVIAMHNARHQLENPRRNASLIEDISEWRRKDKLLTYDQAANRIIGWLESIGVDRKTTALTGSTISFDRGFLAVRMKDLNEWFDYHSVDTSSIQIAIQMFGPTQDLHTIGKPTDRKIHRAIPDCEDSLTKYRWEIAIMKMGLNNIPNHRQEQERG